MGLHEIWIKWENKEVFKHGKVGRSFTSRSVHHTTTTNQYLLLSLWTHYQAVQLNNECFESLKVKSLISHVDISLINVYILCIDYPSTQYYVSQFLEDNKYRKMVAKLKISRLDFTKNAVNMVCKSTQNNTQENIVNYIFSTFSFKIYTKNE